MSRLLGLIQNFQKLDYMDLNIVGNPTINNGVVSDFSSGNYVHILNFANTFNSLEIVTKAKKSATGNQPILCLQNGNTNQSKFYLYITNTIISFRYYSQTDNESKNFYINYNFENNTYYYFRLFISNSKIVLGFSIDGKIWTEQEVIDTIAIAPSMDLRYGAVTNNAWYFDGSIDFNESYIKRDGTKYLFRLPNLINLITVGSPTITGTVVSNFSDNDYLKISSTNFSFDRNIDLYFKIHTDQINDDQSIFSSIQKPTGITEYDCFISLNAVNKYGFNSIRKNNHQLFQQAELNFNNDVDIYFHFSWNYNTKLFKFGYSYDGTTYSYPISINDGYSYYKLISDIYIGKAIINGSYGNLNAFAGSIDLDETKTYAIIDNKKYTFKLS